jgi:chromate transporter
MEWVFWVAFQVARPGNLCPDRERATIAVVAAALMLAVPSTIGQVGAIIMGGPIGWRFLAGDVIPLIPLPVRISRAWPIASIILFFGILIFSPNGCRCDRQPPARRLWRLHRSGSLVFGGGYVVLPLLQTTVVPPGWVDNDTFLAGYGVAQAVPGPLFTFSAYLGMVMKSEPNSWLGGLDAVMGRLPDFG